MIKKISLVLTALLSGLFLANCSDSSTDDPEPPQSPSLQVDVSSSSLDDTPLSSSLQVDVSSSSSDDAPSSSSLHIDVSSSSSDSTPSSSSSAEILDQSQENLLKLSRDNRLYLGRGYDVINSSYINREDVKRMFPVLDQEMMIRDGLIVSEPISGQQVFQTFTGTSRAEFYENVNESMNVGSNAKVPFKAVLFSGKFSTEFKLLQNDNRIYTSMYLRGRSHRYTQDEYIKTPTAERLVKYFDENFAANLTSGNANQILDRYGSHVLIQYNKGGAMEFNYTYYGSELKSNTQLLGALNASLSARVFGFGGGVSGGVTGGTSNSKDELESKSVFNSLIYGGIAINASSWEQIERNYDTWLSSIAGNADICGIGQFDQSFIPIWELAEAGGEAGLAKELKAEFDRRAAEQGKALLTKKSVTEIKEFTASNIFTFNKSFPVTVEIYALGPGGGGQGGYKSDAAWSSHKGTGAGGGSGSAAYIKFSATEQTAFDIKIGAGGEGGSGFFANIITDWKSGDKGKDGENTSVTWGANTLTAEGGKGGGGTGQILTGGAGGEANKTWPTGILDSFSAPGGNGFDGFKDGNKESCGGKPASISRGSVIPFGGGSGGCKNQTQVADLGGGGAGQYNNNKGSRGGNGKVVLVFTYYE